LFEVVDFLAKVGKNQKTKLFLERPFLRVQKKQAHQKNPDAPL
jgi:hypothetical protein